MKLHSFVILIESFSTSEIDELLITDVIKNAYKFILTPVLSSKQIDKFLWRVFVECLHQHQELHV